MTIVKNSYTTQPESLEQLRNDFARIKAEQKLRNREAAFALGISEGEALAAFVGENVVRLDTRFIDLFEEVPMLGPVMALTRNDAAVHEKDGQFANMSHEGPTGIALGDPIDLRIFYSKWAAGFAVTDITPRGTLKSLQFFDAQGHATHKVYLREHSDHAAYAAFVERWAHPEQTVGMNVTAAPAAPVPTSDEDIDVPAFHAAWHAMTDTHQFFGLLRKFKLARTQALRLAESRYAQRVTNDAIATVLNQAAQTELPIMVFVGNHGMIQIHTGPVKTIQSMGPWLNVLDPGFNLHLRTDLIDSAWVVRKPTGDGIVTSLELFDSKGESIAMLFGARKPGSPELAGWRELIANLAPVTEKTAEVTA